MRLPLVMFDFDGTLADSLAVAAEVLAAVGPRLGLRPPPDPATARTLPTRQLLRGMGVRFWMLPRVVRAFRDEAAQYAPTLALHPGVSELLHALHAAGHRLAVVTSNREDSVRACLRARGVEHLFWAVEGNPRLFGKARSLRRVCRAAGVPRRRAVYVGDELRDVRAGRRAGVTTVAVTWGFHAESLLRTGRPDYVARDPAGVAAAVGGGG